MVTVHREGGFRIVIYKNDHEPAHVHVIKDGEVIINLVGAGDRPQVKQAHGATNADVRRSLQIVTKQQASLLARWQEIRDGTD